MTTSTIAASAAERPSGAGGVRLLGRRLRPGRDALALLVLLLLTLLGLMASFARAPQIELGVAGRYNRPYLQNFHDPEAFAGRTTPSYRWTRERSAILAPGLGRGLWQTELRLLSPQPAGQPKQALIETDGQRWLIQLAPAERTYHLLTPSAGDLSLAIVAPTDRYGSDPRPLGVVFAGVSFDPIAANPLPPLAFLLYALIALTLAFITLRLIGLDTWLALSAPLIGLALLVWGTAIARAPMGLFMPRLAALAVVALLLTPLVWLLWRWLIRLGRLDPAPWLLPALLAIFYIGFWIKAAGLLFPYAHVVDIDWHVRDIMLVVEGRWREFYLPSYFSYGKMPVAEWGANPPLLPYTPFFHITVAPLVWLPWPMATSVNVFSVFFDANRSVMIGPLALGWGLKSRGALLAALLYAITPFTFALHSWGNVPTTFGIWWALLVIVVLTLTWGRWHERRVFALLTAVLLASFLYYLVIAVFTGFFVILLAIALLLWRNRPAGQIKALLGSATLALLLSIAVYYIFFIPEMIERTLPYILGTVARGQVNEGQADHISLSQYLRFHWTHMGYLNYPVRHGVWIPTLLALPGLWVLRRNRLALIMLGSWLVVAFLFFVVGLRVSMVDKYIFYAMPGLAIAAAAVFDRFWNRNLVVPLATVAIFVFTCWSALELWILRLQRVGI